MRRFLVLAIVGAGLWSAPGAFAAGWCGSGESAIDRPDATTGAQIHALWVVPADSPDTFATGAGKLADDLTSLSTWWVGQDSTRTPRVDTAAFAAGSCADLSFVRLAEPASAFAGANNAYGSVVQELETDGFANLFKKYIVYYDGPTVETDVCGTGAGDFSSGPSFAIVWLQACPDVPTDAIEAHELLHSLGALPAGAPNACTAANNPVGAFADPGHPCDSNKDVLYPEATPGVPLSQLVLDFNHDDYYAHSGAWNDLQDSDWLHLIASPIVPLAVKIVGGGVVMSVVPGVVCGSSCTTQWDGGTETALLAQAAHGKRFVGWTGGCTGRADCALTLGSAVSVTATFGPTRVPLALGKVGNGTVTCVPKCGKTFAAGSRLTLHAVPAKGWKFASWTGDCAKVHVATCRPRTDFHVSARAIFRRR